MGLTQAQRDLLAGMLEKHGLRTDALEPDHNAVRVAEMQGELSDREIEVLLEVARGYTNKEIAKRLILSEETVKSHLRHILGKMGVTNRARAVALGYENGLLTPGDAV